MTAELPVPHCPQKGDQLQPTAAQSAANQLASLHDNSGVRIFHKPLKHVTGSLHVIDLQEKEKSTTAFT